jgi:hypothetical protein
MRNKQSEVELSKSVRVSLSGGSLRWLDFIDSFNNRGVSGISSGPKEGFGRFSLLDELDTVLGGVSTTLPNLLQLQVICSVARTFVADKAIAYSDQHSSVSISKGELDDFDQRLHSLDIDALKEMYHAEYERAVSSSQPALRAAAQDDAVTRENVLSTYRAASINRVISERYSLQYSMLPFLHKHDPLLYDDIDPVFANFCFWNALLGFFERDDSAALRSFAALISLGLNNSFFDFEPAWRDKLQAILCVLSLRGCHNISPETLLPVPAGRNYSNISDEVNRTILVLQRRGNVSPKILATLLVAVWQRNLTGDCAYSRSLQQVQQQLQRSCCTIRLIVKEKIQCRSVFNSEVASTLLQRGLLAYQKVSENDGGASGYRPKL